MSASSIAHADIAVLGAGSWGTALAIQFARAGRPARLWGRDRAHVEAMVRERSNARYLPDVNFPDSLHLVTELAAAVDGVNDVLLAVPSHAFRGLLRQLLPLLPPASRLCWATKGFELDSGRLPNQVAHEVFGSSRSVAVLSGPTFAAEVGRGLPTAMTIASPDEDYAEKLARDLSSASFQSLYIHRHHWRGSGWGQSKNTRARDRRWHVGWDGLWRQYPHRIDYPWSGRDDATGRGTGCAPGNLHGTGRSGRSGIDLYRQSLAQPAFRSRAGAGCQRCSGAAADRAGG